MVVQPIGTNQRFISWAEAYRRLVQHWIQKIFNKVFRRICDAVLEKFVYKKIVALLEFFWGGVLDLWWLYLISLEPASAVVTLALRLLLKQTKALWKKYPCKSIRKKIENLKDHCNQAYQCATGQLANLLIWFFNGLNRILGGGLAYQ